MRRIKENQKSLPLLNTSRFKRSCLSNLYLKVRRLFIHDWSLGQSFPFRVRSTGIPPTRFGAGVFISIFISAPHSHLVKQMGDTYQRQGRLKKGRSKVANEQKTLAGWDGWHNCPILIFMVRY